MEGGGRYQPQPVIPSSSKKVSKFLILIHLGKYLLSEMVEFMYLRCCLDPPEP